MFQASSNKKIHLLCTSTVLHSCRTVPPLYLRDRYEKSLLLVNNIEHPNFTVSIVLYNIFIGNYDFSTVYKVNVA